MPINLEISHSTDASALAQMHAACFERSWSADDFAQMLGVPGTYALLAAKDTLATGFALIRTLDAVMEILTLAVLPRYRRQGIGEQLSAALERQAKEQGAESIFLEVRQSNKGAIALYAKRGFTPLSIRRDYYRNADNSAEHAIVMRRMLD